MSGIFGFSSSPRTVQPVPPGSDTNLVVQKINELIAALSSVLVSAIEYSSAQTMDPNRTYVANHASTRVVLTLPMAATEGDSIVLVGKGAAGWKIAQNAGQTIHGSSSATTAGTGGSLASGAQYNCVELICVINNTDFVIRNHEGTLTFV